MDEFTEPGRLSDDELFACRAELADELHWLCLRRWVLFDQIDLLRSEKVRRLRASFATAGTEALVTEPDYRSMAGRAGMFSGCGEADPLQLGRREPLAALPPVPSLGIERIRELLHSTKDVENDVSMRRQIAWARLKVLEAEISRRFDESDR